MKYYNLSNFLSFLFVAGADYQPVSVVVTFPPTPIVAIECPQIPLIDDTIPEPDESFEVQISTASCQVLQNTFTVNIQGKSRAITIAA